MSKYELIVSTPDKEVFRGNVDKLIVRSTQGDVCILRGHANFITTLDVGVMRIVINDVNKYAALAGGFMKVDKKNTVIFSPSCEWAEEIDIDRAKRAEKLARERLNSDISNVEYDMIELALKRSITRLSVAKHKSKM